MGHEWSDVDELWLWRWTVLPADIPSSREQRCCPSSACSGPAGAQRDTLLPIAKGRSWVQCSQQPFSTARDPLLHPAERKSEQEGVKVFLTTWLSWKESGVTANGVVGRSAVLTSWRAEPSCSGDLLWKLQNQSIWYHRLAQWKFYVAKHGITEMFNKSRLSVYFLIVFSGIGFIAF